MKGVEWFLQELRIASEIKSYFFASEDCFALRGPSDMQVMQQDQASDCQCHEMPSPQQGRQWVIRQVLDLGRISSKGAS